MEEQQYNRNVEDFEIWLAEVEAQLLSEDYGKDLTSVQNLQKKHALLDADINSRQVMLTEFPQVFLHIISCSAALCGLLFSFCCSKRRYHLMFSSGDFKI